MADTADLLPGFAYAQPRFQGLSASQQWRFHLTQLRWLLCAPSLLSRHAGAAYGLSNPGDAPSVWHPDASERESITRWLDALTTLTPEQIHHQINSLNAAEGAAPLRLGRYAEKLLGLFLRTSPLFSVCAEGLALREHTEDVFRTVGEVDFIVRDQIGRLAHWELAVKFFCYQPPQTRAALAQDFVGPDGADSLERKLSKVFGEQLRRALPAPFDAATVLRQAYSAGYLFYPLNTQSPACMVLNPAHARGHWLRPAQLAQLPEANYLALPRWRWLAPAYVMAADQMLTKSDLAARLAAHWRAQSQPSAAMLAQLNGAGEECARFFVRRPGNQANSSVLSDV